MHTVRIMISSFQKKNICIYMNLKSYIRSSLPGHLLALHGMSGTPLPPGRNLLEKFNHRGSGLKDTRLTEARIPH